MKRYGFLIFLIISFSSKAQSNVTRFFELSAPLKTWVLFHPFKAKRALAVSEEAKKVSDSIKNKKLLTGNGSGGQVDAFRHAYWMARLHQEIGYAAAKSLGKSYERAAYRFYKKNKLEDDVLPDAIGSEMDLWNNKVGLRLTKKKGSTPKKALIERVINAIHEGKMKIISIDKKGCFLDCNQQVILPENWKGKWKNSKCLIPSNSAI